jgi:Tol biopolymer transport system component
MLLLPGVLIPSALLAPCPQTVEKVSGTLATQAGATVGDVSSFAWTPDGRYFLYGADRNNLDIDVVTSVRVADRSEAVYEPYTFFFGTVGTGEFVFLPERDRVAVRLHAVDGSGFPPNVSSLLHVLGRADAVPTRTIAADQARFLDDGRMLHRTVDTPFHGNSTYRAWRGRWDDASPSLEISPPAQDNNYVSALFAAPEAGVVVFGWRDSFSSSNDAELLAVPLAGGPPVPLIPPAVGLRSLVDVHFVRAADELVVYSADETPGATDLWAVPVDGSVAPRRLSPPAAVGQSPSYVGATPDEQRILFTADYDQPSVYELWSSELDSGASVRLTPPLVAGGNLFSYDVWISPDSRRVVYLADQRSDGVDELFSAPLDGSSPPVALHAPLTTTMDALEPVRFTPDGARVIFAVRISTGVVLASAPTDGSAAPTPLNLPFPTGGGVATSFSGVSSTVALGSGGRHAFFLGAQTTAGVVELYSVQVDGSAPPVRWNAPLVNGGDVTHFALRPGPGALLYRADQDEDEVFELYLSSFPDTPPPTGGAATPGASVTRTVELE